VELRSLVKKVFDYLQQEGQLDQTSLTLNDLNVAADSFATTLRNSYHPRIVYPEIRTTSSPTEPVVPDKKDTEITESGTK
jgi:cyclic-di-AMP phosphodiesterase PgpH